MTREHPPCVMCRRFSIVGRSEEAAQGRGYCDGHEKVMQWDGQPCVLFLLARDEAPRRAFAEKHSNNKKETEAA